MPTDPQLQAFYQTLAPQYDAIHDGFCQGADIRFYQELAAESGGPVLEMGCGTGRVLLPVAQAGIPIVGLDGSAAMLDELRTNLAQQPPGVQGRVSLVEGDIRTTPLGRRFPFIFSAGNVLHSFLERADQRAWLRNVREHLDPSGVFCFDLFQPDYRRISAEPQWLLDIDRIDSHTGNRVRCYSLSEHEPEYQRFHVELRWIVEDPEGRVLTDQSASVMQRWFTRAELENLLELEGFQVTAYWGSFAREPFGRGSMNQIVRAGLG